MTGPGRKTLGGKFSPRRKLEVSANLTHARWAIDAHPRVLLARRFYNDDPDFRVQFCSAYHTLHLYDYQTTMRLGPRRIELNPGDVTITPLGISSSYATPVPGHHLCIYFQSGAPTSGGQITLPLVWRLGPWKEIATQKIASIAHYLPEKNTDPITAAAASAAMQELLLWLAVRGRAEAQPLDRGRLDYAVGMAAQWILNHLDQPLVVQDIAAQVGLSQNYLAQAFKRHFAMTIPHYILCSRIEQAKNLIETTNRPIQAIGQQVGLPDPHHFNKQFRRIAGESPTTYRAALRRSRT